MTKVKGKKKQDESAESAVDEQVEVSTGDPSLDDAVDVPADKTDEAKAEPDWQDRYLRLAAEFDNFRKRSAREFFTIVQTAERELIAELTEVLDNFDRALSADHAKESVDEFAKGVELIREQIWKALASRGLEKMETVGKPFDPKSHEALMRMPSEEHAENICVQEATPGYRLKDNVLRHARVVVSQGKPENGNDDQAES